MKESAPYIVGVLLPLPFNEPFDYKSDVPLSIGTIVRVPWGKEQQIGVVWKIGKSSALPEHKIKPIIESFNFPPLSPQLIQFIKFVAEYNMAFLGLVLKMVISVRGVFDNSLTTTLYKLSGKTLAEAKLKNSDARWHVMDLLKHAPYSKSEICQGAGVSIGVVDTLIKAGILLPFTKKIKKEFALPIYDYHKVVLTPEQTAAAQQLIERIGNGFHVTLLDGITGSGKTEVYFEAVAEALKQEKQVLILVPEISLTTQWLGRFEKRFGVTPACWHSGLGTRERIDNWTAIAEGRAKVVVGARSALFLPYPDLGVIVIDESHDHSFKQEDVVNYQGRDMAVVRAKLEQIPLILSTATPDLETVCNVEEGKYDCVKLTSRYAAAELPEIQIIDLKKDKPQKGGWGTSWLAPTLVNALKENLEKHEQSVLFLNRRGYAPLTICRDCGHRIQCPHCTAWLTEHRHIKKLVCHHCGFSMDIPSCCPECGSEDGLTACGPGVERIAEEVRGRFPKARIDIISSDITTNLNEVSEVIRKMENNEVDILIGTQIIAKGHHFPQLTVVGIVDADLGLMGSDLRASEQTFQLLSQVSGRAGRGEKKGMVYVQTLYPENAVLKALIDNDRSRFLDLEKQTRQILKMPPFGRLAALIVSGVNQSNVEKIAIQLGQTAPNNDYITTLGPAQAPIYMLRGKYRYRLLLKTARNIKIQAVLAEWLAKVACPPSVRIEVDIDPYSFM
ncbi:MAG: primosomal protein N' [Alphaproteobacteria bacterium]|nr:primosomal protein N' [Alphaproteobacteria bacterium]